MTAQTAGIAAQEGPGRQILHDFAPDSASARALDQGVVEAFAQSLQSLFDTIGGDLGTDPSMTAALVRRVRKEGAPPGAFGLYSDLVLAAAADRVAEARRLASALLASSPQAAALRLVTLADAELGPGQADRYRRLAGSDQEGLNLSAVTAAEKGRAGELIDEAFRLLGEAAPELAGELRALLREIVLVDGASSEGVDFGGAATFYLWGAVFVNSPRLTGRHAVVQALVHETAHLHLFGLTKGEPVVMQDDGEALYPSPLREDPRPLEGVAHAAFVLARLMWCEQRLLASGRLDDGEAAQAKSDLASFRADYAAAMRPVKAHARLTDEGAAIFAAADRFVRSLQPAG